MEKEQKPRRPRIGEARGAASREGGNEKYEKVNYTRRNDNDYNYNRRPYNNDNRNYNRRNDNYGGGNHYQRNYNADNNTAGEDNFNRYATNDYGYNRNHGERQGGYNRPDNYQGGYNRNNYNNRRPYRPHADNGEEPNYNTVGENRPFRQQGGNRQGFNNRGGGYNKPYGGNQRRSYGGGNNRQQRVVIPRRIVYDESMVDPNEPIRLNKFLANSGVCSRREADEFIQKGEIKVNGEVVTELGTKITRNDVVTHNDKVVLPEHKIYVLLNKPKDCVTTSDDPQGRLTVMDIVRNACTERIYPVGRLDRNTTGVLLLTNDGDLASKLTHPKFVKKKIYHVWLDRDVTEEDMQRIADGIELEDGPIHADAISYATETDRNQVGIEIHSGRNRVVRRIFESLGYRVVKLDRVYFAGLTKKNLPRGRWRYLTQQEVNFLKMGSFE